MKDFVVDGYVFNCDKDSYIVVRRQNDFIKIETRSKDGKICEVIYSVATAENLAKCILVLLE